MATSHGTTLRLMLIGLFVAVTLLVNPSAAMAQAVQPVENANKPYDPAENLSNCFENPATFYGPGCGSVVTTADVQKYGPTYYGLSLAAGDTLRCSFGLFDVGGTCSLRKPNGAISTVKQNFSRSTTGSVTDPTTGGTTADPNLDRSATENLIVDAGNALSGVGEAVVTVVGSTILTIANLLLGIAGTLLNFVVVKTVFEFGSVIGNSPGILVAWGIFRDLGNLVLLFGFIFMGLAMILNLNTFSAQKAIPRLLIFAILMNFSLFVAEAVIDTTNAVSSVIYSQANGDKFCLQDIAGVPITAQGLGLTEQSDATSVDALNDCAVNYGIAGQIMQSTGLSTMWKTNGDFGATTATYVGLALFATIGAVVLFAAAIMLSIRLVVLSFLMVTSPIGFAGMAIPPLQKYAKMWWDKLISQSIFAPILFILIFVSLKITDSFVKSADQLSLAAALTQPNASIMGIVLVFVLVIGFMVASLVVARSIGAQGASGAINLGTKIARGTFGGVAGVAGRNTIGRASSSLQKRYSGSGLASSKLLQGNPLGRAVDRGLVAGLGAGKDFTFGSSSSFEQTKKRDKERKEEVEKARRKSLQDADLKKATALPATTPAERDAKNDKIAEILERMSVKELEELDTLKKSGADLDALAKNLSPEKFSALVKDGGALTDVQKKALKEARFKEATDQLKKTNEVLGDPSKTDDEKKAARDDLKAAIKKYSVKDLENAPSTFFDNDEVAKSLNNSQRDDLLKNGKLSPAAARKVRSFDPVEQINTKFRQVNAAEAVGVISRMGKKPSNKQIARLDSNLLTSREFVRGVLDLNMLKAIQERDELTKDEVLKIAGEITSLDPAGRYAPALKAFITSTEGGYWRP